MVHSSIKSSLGFKSNMGDEAFLEKWTELTKGKRKPCWDLKYCPYGPLVEQFPLLPTRRDAAIKHNDYLKSCLEKGKLGVEPNTKPIPKDKRKIFEKLVKTFNPDDHPEELPSEIEDWSCNIFGHICPVVFSAEKVAEEHEG